jgi:hypothetical protein
MGGDGILLESVSLDQAQEGKIKARFTAERDQAYAEFISRCDDFESEIARERAVDKFIYAEVRENEEDLVKLRAWLEKIVRLDLFGASLRGEAEERVERCAAVLDDYTREVFERDHDHWITIAWMIIEATVAIAAGVNANSVRPLVRTAI